MAKCSIKKSSFERFSSSSILERHLEKIVVLKNNDLSANQNAPQFDDTIWITLVRRAISMLCIAEKNEGTQFFVKIIQGYYVLKLTFRLKYMVHFIAFHRFPIISQTKITNDFQAFNCRLLIIKQKSPVFQHFHLVGNTYGLLSICFHRCIKNKFRPGTHCKEAWRKLLLQR